jgi:hypothetical protein
VTSYERRTWVPYPVDTNVDVTSQRLLNHQFDQFDPFAGADGPPPGRVEGSLRPDAEGELADERVVADAELTLLDPPGVEERALRDRARRDASVAVRVSPDPSGGAPQQGDGSVAVSAQQVHVPGAQL